MEPTQAALLAVVKQQLASTGSQVLEDDVGALATILPSHELEGHFRVDPQPDGSWRIWGTFPDDEIRVSGAVSANALAALATEALLEARHRYCVEFDRQPIPSPVPPPYVRAMQRSRLAEDLVAIALGAEKAPSGNAGFDLIASGRRIQVKSSVRNPRSGLISTLQFRSDKAYFDHDELVYLEFTPFNVPVRAWHIQSDLFRSHAANDKRTHQVESLLIEHGSDVTGEIACAFDTLCSTTERL